MPVDTTVSCRPGCAACCTAPSISSAIPGMAQGKPAGVPCVQLDPTGRCRLFGRPDRPAVCSSLQASPDMCGSSRQHAMQWLARLEAATAPAAPAAAGQPAGAAITSAATPSW
ncbi:MAG: YkgJ family cysteine cluster protein [Pseudomonadota bacterium]